jgi:hypothetical protein
MPLPRTTLPQRVRRFGGRSILMAALVALMAAMALPAAAGPVAAASRRFVGFGLTGTGDGYLMVSSAGEFYAFGSAHPWTNAVASTGIVGVSVTGNGQGALAVSTTGQFYAYGNAHPWPNIVGSTAIVDVAVTADGQGALAVSTTGQFYAYGNAHPWPNPAGFSSRMTSVALTGDGRGLVAVSNTGQFYAYGTANPHPNLTGQSGDIVKVALSADGRGLAAMSSSGQMYAYAPVQWHGNGDPGSTAPASLAELATRILNSPGIDTSGRLVRTDLQDAAAGKPSSNGYFLSTAVLTIVLTAAQNHTLKVTALESGGTGHSAGSRHYYGDGVDFGYFDSGRLTGRNSASLALIRAAMPALGRGTRIGQISCALDRNTTMPGLPSGVNQIGDTCDHVHFDVPRGTP